MLKKAPGLYLGMEAYVVTLKLFSVQISPELNASLVICGYSGNLKLQVDCAPKGKSRINLHYCR